MTPTQKSILERALARLRAQAETTGVFISEANDDGAVIIDGEVNLVDLFQDADVLVSLLVLGSCDEPLPEGFTLTDEFPGNCAIQLKTLLQRAWPQLDWEVVA